MPGQRAARPPVVFAHQSEAEIARLLDFYGVAWEYEPRSFPLEWNDAGRMTQSFTPDFYLPDYDLFLEVTTVKPALKNRKNRKVRLLRELYPDIMIKLLTLKDVEALMLKYGRHGAIENGATGADIKSLSAVERLADFAHDRSSPSASLSVPTDLATYQDRSERGET